MSTERRRFERRRHAAEHMGERGMRCEGCGTVWYSAVASTVVAWGRCIQCDGSLHLERRMGADRRSADVTVAA
jgi:hypothetical protein